MFLEALWRPSSVRDSSGGLGDQHMNNTLLSTYIYTYINIFICVRTCVFTYLSFSIGICTILHTLYAIASKYQLHTYVLSEVKLSHNCEYNPPSPHTHTYTRTYVLSSDN